MRALVTIRGRDTETEALHVMDMIDVEIPNDPKKIRKLLDVSLTNVLLSSHDKLSDLYDINIQLKR